VVHGTADTLLPKSGGERTAEVIPGADLVLIEGWGHDMPPGAWPDLIEAISVHAGRVDEDHDVRRIPEGDGNGST
jgi:pimeloyl-ACP methyl ester carboxylesterase